MPGGRPGLDTGASRLGKKCREKEGEHKEGRENPVRVKKALMFGLEWGGKG